jgi:hypothetical protein
MHEREQNWKLNKKKEEEEEEEAYNKRRKVSLWRNGCGQGKHKNKEFKTGFLLKSDEEWH